MFHPLEKIGFSLMLIGVGIAAWPLLQMFFEKAPYGITAICVVIVGGAVMLTGQSMRHRSDS